MKKLYAIVTLLLSAGFNGLYAQNDCSTAVNITVKPDEESCFTNYTSVVTVDVGSAFVPPGTCSTTDDNAYWAKFTATGTETDFYMWGKDKDNANFIVYSGTCAGLTQIFCKATGVDNAPFWGSTTTVPGQTYYILIHHKMTTARLCVYTPSSEPTKPVCTANMSFENGAATGWQSFNGAYHLVSAPGTQFMYDVVPGSVAGRFAVTSGAANDAFVGGMVPVVAPGGGTYSYRIGYNGGSVNGFADPQPAPNGFNPGTVHASVEQMTYCFTVDPTNAGFGYKYATVMDAPPHAPELQPLFEVFIVHPSTGDTIQCGNHNHYPHDAASPFHYVGDDLDILGQGDGICFTPWTDVLTDLSGYAGQQVCVTFRVRDCEGGGVVQCCPYDIGLQGGSHGAYAYFDTYCIPMTITTPEFCAGAQSIQICAPPGYASYSWPAGQPGLAGSPTTECVTITNPIGGTEYTVNMISITGCPKTTKVILKNIPLTKTADTTFCGPSAGPIPLQVSVTNPIDPPYSYSWSNGLGTGPGVNVNPTPGLNSYIVTVTNGSGCTSNDTIFVTVQTCTPTVNTAGTTICKGTCATVQATGLGGQAPYTYSWSGGAGTGSSVSVCPTINTTYTVTMTDQLGNTTQDTAVISVYQPTITVSPSTAICSGSSAVLTAGGSAGTYSWNPGTTGTTTTVSPTTNTVYSVSVTDANNCSVSTSTTVNVNALPIPIHTPNSAICKNSGMTLTASGGTSYSWNPGTAGSSMTVTPSATTTYHLTVTDANNCTAVDSVIITVNPFLTVIASNDTAICSGASAFLTSSAPNASSYSWSNAATTASITVSPSSFTTYIVEITDINGCKGTDTVRVTVNPLPAIGASVTPSAVCIGTGSTLNGTGAVSYSWTPINQTGNGISVQPTTAGTYPYNVVGTDANGCTGAGSTTLTVNPLPTPTITAPLSVCTGTPTTLTAGGGTSYSWSPVNMTGPSITVTPSSNSNYTVTVTDGNGCRDTAITNIIVNPFLTVTVQPDTICVGQSTILNAVSSGATNYTWSTSETTQAITVNPSSDQTYSIDVSNNFGCNGNTSVTVKVNPLPTVFINQPLAICSGQSATLTASGGNNYLWTPSTGGTFTGSSVPVIPSTTTSYNLVVTDANNCSNTATTSVTVNPLPIVTISQAAAFCQGNSMQLTAGGALNYTWTPGGIVASSLSINPSATTTYVVNASDVNGCTGSNSVTITVYPAPIADAGADRNICEGQATQLHPLGVSGLWSYSWSPSTDLSNDTIPDPIFTGRSSTTYYLSVSASNSNCPPDIDTVDVIVHPIPSIDAGQDTSITAGKEVQLFATAGGSVQWYPATTLSCVSCLSPVALPLKTTTYIVTTVDSFGCRNRDTVIVNVEDILTLYVPNAFRPLNQYGGNKMFFAFGEGVYTFEFYIFNRWGEKVFETTDLYTGWDGSYKGSQVQDDVYVWLAKAKSITGKSITRTGPVTVVR